MRRQRKEETIVQIRDGRVITSSQYRKMVDEWNDITVPPSTIGKPRKTMIDKIVRYRLIESSNNRVRRNRLRISSHCLH